MKPPMDKQIIYYNSDQAAQPAKLILADGTEETLWIASDGSGFRDEHTARWKGCTHNQCECGKWKKKNGTLCETCSTAARKERFKALPAKDYDGSPVCIWGDDTFFWDLDGILDFCEENEVKKEELQLVFCVPNTPPQVSWDHFNDEVPDDSDGNVFSKEMIDAVEHLNEIIRAHKPISWSGGNVRVTFGKEVVNG
jgi:hypothetical protein